MRERRAPWAALVVVSAATLVLGTGGFSVAVVDQGVTVTVFDHDRALVSIWDPGGKNPEPPRYAGEDPVTSNDTTARLIVVENRFLDRTLDVRVAERPGSPVAVDGSHDGLRPSAVAPVTAEVDCDDRRGRVAVPLVIRATTVDGGFDGEISYDASVVCPVPDPNPGSVASGSSS